MSIRTCLASILGVFVVSSFPSFAFAAEDGFAPPDKQVSADRLSASGDIGIASMMRSTGTSSSALGGTVGGEVDWMHRGIHGVRLGYAFGAGGFGPEVHVVDLDYRWQWNSSPKLERVTYSLGTIIGPSIGFVNYLGENPDQHASFGGNVGAFADMHVWMFTVGVDAAYRLGFATGYNAEGIGTVGLHAGLTFDLAKR